MRADRMIFASARRTAGRRAARAIAVTVLATIALAAGVSRCMPAETPASVDERPGGSLTSGQVALVESYGTEERTFVELLETRAWSSRTSGAGARFSDGSVTVLDGGETSREEPFAIAALAEASAADGTRSWTAKVLLGDGSTAELRVVEEADSDGRAGYTLTLPPLFASALESAPLDVDLDVELPAAEVMERLGVDGDAIAAAVESFAAAEAPTSTDAVWTGDAAFDYSSGIASFDFLLNDADQTRAVVDVAFGTGAARTHEA